MKDLLAKKTKSNEKQKEIYIEALRVFAMIFVIFNHTSDDGFFYFSNLDPSQFRFWLDMLFTVFCKFAVPMFFALSGSLMLGEEISFKKQSRRILRALMILILISLVYYIKEQNVYNYPMTIGDFFTRVYSYRLKYHLWYLYDYIVFLVTMPFINKIAQNLTKKTFYYLCAIVIMTQAIIPVFEYLVIDNAFSIYSHLKPTWLIEQIVVYPLVGYYLSKEKEETSTKQLLILWIINIILVLFTCWLTYKKSVDTGVLNESSSQGFLSIFALFNVIIIYKTFKKAFQNKSLNRCIEVLILSAGSCTFGVYLFHLLLLDLPIKRQFFDWVQSHGIYGIWPSFLFVLFVFVACWGGTLILKLIPGVKKWI